MKNIMFAATAAIVLAAGNGCCLCQKLCGGCGADSCCESGCSAGCKGGCSDGCRCGQGGHCEGGACGAGGCNAGCGADCIDGYRTGLLTAKHQGGVHPGCGPTGIPYDSYQATPGPSAAGVAYPYYTNRGPRDFLSSAPRSIGP